MMTTAVLHHPLLMEMTMRMSHQSSSLHQVECKCLHPRRMWYPSQNNNSSSRFHSINLWFSRKCSNNNRQIQCISSLKAMCNILICRWTQIILISGVILRIWDRSKLNSIFKELRIGWMGRTVISPIIRFTKTHPWCIQNSQCTWWIHLRWSSYSRMINQCRLRGSSNTIKLLNNNRWTRHSNRSLIWGKIPVQDKGTGKVWMKAREGLLQRRTSPLRLSKCLPHLLNQQGITQDHLPCIHSLSTSRWHSNRLIRTQIKWI